MPITRICTINNSHPKVYVYYTDRFEVFTIQGFTKDFKPGTISEYPFPGRRQRWYVTQWAPNRVSLQWDWIALEDEPHFNSRLEAIEYLLVEFAKKIQANV